MWDGTEQGHGKLYQGCHPNIYGHDIAWQNVEAIFDLDNGPEEGYYNGANKVDWPAYPPVFPEGHIYMRWKIEDGDVPDRALIKNIGDFGASLLIGKRNVLVHCAAGQNRSALITASIFHSLYPQVTGEQIYHLIKERNPMALTNYVFRNFVLDIDKPKVSYG